MQTVRLVPTTHSRRPPAQTSTRAWPTQAIIFWMRQPPHVPQTHTAAWVVQQYLLVSATRDTRDQTGDLARRVKQGNIKKLRDLPGAQTALQTAIQMQAAQVSKIALVTRAIMHTFRWQTLH